MDNTQSGTYRAAVVERFGPPENSRIVELEARPLAPGQVRVAVRTGGLNPVDAVSGVAPSEAVPRCRSAPSSPESSPRWATGSPR